MLSQTSQIPYRRMWQEVCKLPVRAAIFPCRSHKKNGVAFVTNGISAKRNIRIIDDNSIELLSPKVHMKGSSICMEVSYFSANATILSDSRKQNMNAIEKLKKYTWIFLPCPEIVQSHHKYLFHIPSSLLSIAGIRSTVINILTKIRNITAPASPNSQFPADGQSHSFGSMIYSFLSISHAILSVCTQAQTVTHRPYICLR